jgi:hypothetical protein
MRDSGQPDEPSLAPPEGARSEETRRSIDRRAEGAKIRGDPEIHRRDRRRARDSRQLEDPPVGIAGGCRIRGNPGTRRRSCGRSEDSGRPGDSPLVTLKDARFEVTRSSVAGTAGRCWMRGNLQPHRSAAWDDAWF